MTKSKGTKRAFLGSIITMMICLAMLVGSTFAWFTDSVVSGTNKIVAGNLDVELLHSNGNVKDETKVLPDSKLFVDVNGQDIKWEPGVMVYENFTVKNVGNLALKYKLRVIEDGFNTVTVNESKRSLKNVLKVAVLKEHFNGDRNEALKQDFSANLDSFQLEDALKPGQEGTDGKKYAVIIYWEPTDYDNYYNLKDDRQTDDKKDELFINLGVLLDATQDTVENDSFDDQYDKDAQKYDAVASTTEELVDVMKNAKDGDNIKVTSDITLNTPLILTKNVSIQGNGNKISGQPIYTNANLTVENIILASPTNANKNASTVYAVNGCKKLAFKNVTFDNPEYEAVQVTSRSLTEMTLDHCTFTYDKVPNPERAIHCDINGVVKPINFTITNNTFNNCDKLTNAMVGLYGVVWNSDYTSCAYEFPDGSTLTLGKNTFNDKDADEAKFLDKFGVCYPSIPIFNTESVWTGEIQTISISPVK